MNFIDLFAGCGGLSEGFTKAGFTGISHVEMCSNASKTLRTRIAYHYLKKKNKLNHYKDYLNQNITNEQLWEYVPDFLQSSVINTEITKKSLHTIFSKIDNSIHNKQIDLIVGGPPCQAYSVVGRSRDIKGMKWDRRNFLFRFYAEFLNKYKPKVFIFENVLGLLSAGQKRYFNEMIETFTNLDYSVDWKILNSEDFGVLQKRNRVFIIGRYKSKYFKFPQLNKINNKWQIKEDLFFDLPSLKPGQAIEKAKYIKPTNNYLNKSGIRNGFDFVTQHICRPHNSRDLEIYSIAINKLLNEQKRLKYIDLPSRLQTHSNKVSFLDRYKVVNPFGLSHTIVAHISKDGHYYIYPDINQIRSISVREAARIQSFPDDYYFEGGRSSAFKQIGNAVPPLMAERIAISIKDILEVDKQ